MVWLGGMAFDILAFDYPGSGTGKRLHPDQAFRTSKNTGLIIPDIIAFRSHFLAFFENKTWFSAGDVESLLLLRDSGRYRRAVRALRDQCGQATPVVGLALHDTDGNRRSLAGVQGQIDFGITVSSLGIVEVVFAPEGLFN